MYIKKGSIKPKKETELKEDKGKSQNAKFKKKNRLLKK